MARFSGPSRQSVLKHALGPRGASQRAELLLAICASPLLTPGFWLLAPFLHPSVLGADGVPGVLGVSFVTFSRSTVYCR